MGQNVNLSKDRPETHVPWTDHVSCAWEHFPSITSPSWTALLPQDRLHTQPHCCKSSFFYNHFNLSNIPLRNGSIWSYFLEQMIVIFSAAAVGIHHRRPSQVLCQSSEVISGSKISICCADREDSVKSVDVFMWAIVWYRNLSFLWFFLNYLFWSWSLLITSEIFIFP